MGLAETQSALARLYTDTALRERFFADPLAVGLELGLRSEEARQLAQLDAAQAKYFAASLLNKRIDEVSKLLPLSSGVLGQQFRKLFRQYAETHAPVGTKKQLADAVAFASFAARDTRIRSCAPRWIPELLEYEKESLKAAQPGAYLKLRRFRFPVDELARTLSHGDAVSPHLREQPTIVLWFRPTPRSRLRRRIIKGETGKGGNG